MTTNELLPLKTRLQAFTDSARMPIHGLKAAEFFPTMTQLTGNPYYTEIYNSELKPFNTEDMTYPELVDLVRYVRQPERAELLFYLLIEPFSTLEVKK